MPEEVAAKQPQWQPQWDEVQTKKLIEKYDSFPSTFTQENIDSLKEHADAYGIPFYSGDFQIMEAVKQLGAGFIEGFTTIGVADQPDNEYEAIARNIGHLTGFAPSLMARPIRLLGGRSMVAKQIAAKAGALKSIPMLGADYVTKKAKSLARSTLGKASVGRTGAVSTVSNFLLGNKTKHILEGAFHLGIATGISAWQGGIDQMMHAAKGGAEFGAVFAGIGNFIKTKNPKAEMLLRAVSGSLFQGLPSTMRGATTPEQVYEYLMGAYFGSNAVPWHTAKAGKFLEKMEKEAQDNPKLRTSMDPQDAKGFFELPEVVQAEVLKRGKLAFGDPLENEFRSHLLAKSLGQEKRITEEPFEQEGVIVKDEYVDGERITTVDPETIQKYKHLMFSGGAKGIDTEMAKEAKAHGVPVVNYSFKRHAEHIKAPGFIRPLSEAELTEANEAVRQASLSLKRDIKKSATAADPYNYNLLRRNYFQVKFSDSVYAVGQIVHPGQRGAGKAAAGGKKAMKGFINKTNRSVVDGGTGWAIEMAVQKDIPIFVYDTVTGKWHRWNKAVSKFSQIKHPPRPTNRWTGIGMSNIPAKKGAKEAVRNLFDRYFERFTPEEGKKKIVEGEELDEASILTKTEQGRLTEIDKEMEGHSERVLEIEDKSLSNMDPETRAPIDLKLDTELAIEQDKIADKMTLLEEERLGLINKGETLESKAVEKDAEDIDQTELSEMEDLDFDTDVEIKAGKRAWQFLTDGRIKPLVRHLWEKGSATQVEARIKQEKVAAKVTGVITAHLERGSTNPKSEEAVAAIEKVLGITLSGVPDAHGQIRQWINTKNLHKVVKHFRADNVKIESTDKQNPYSLAGARKRQEEPEKPLEKAYREAGGTEDAYGVLDHITAYDKKGRAFDLDVSRYRGNHLLAENDFDVALAEGAWNRWLSLRMRDMASEKGPDGGNWYYMGGKGDADRMYWVKFHPKVTEMESDVTALKALSKILTWGNQVDPKFKDYYKKSKDEFLSQYARGLSTSPRRAIEQLHLRSFLSNVRYDMDMQGMELTKDNFQARIGKNKEHSFVNNSKGYNKRAQIWLTNSWPGSPEYAKNSKVEGLEDGKYKAIITKDLSDKVAKEYDKDGQYGWNTNRKNSELPENLDGGVVGRDDVVDFNNLDAGQPVSGQNKSFIVSSNPKYGALLGKYMIHKAGPKLSELMKEAQIHYILPESAVKQRGKREIGDYDIVNGKLELNAEVYEIPVEDLRYNYSTKTDRHFLDNQKIPKQLMMALNTNMFGKVEQGVVDDMFEQTVGKRWRGEEDMHDYLEDYYDRLDTGASMKELRDMESFITKPENIDRLGIAELADILHRNYAENLSEAVYRYITSNNKSILKDMFKSDEITKDQYLEELTEINNYDTAVQKQIGEASRWADAKRMAGENVSALGTYMHKNVRNYRMEAVKRFIVYSATRPKVANSAVSVMRPYDKAMRMDLDNTNAYLKELETNDEIFFLDNGYRQLRIEHDIDGISPRDNTLEKLWNIYESKPPEGIKAELEEVFRAVTARVPLDSPSGAQVLNFRGFTGRDGHGVLLHGRAMRAEGGADLDGDKAYVFFGGKGGFAPDWKDAFYSQKKEFYQSTGTPEEKVGDNKEALVPGTDTMFKSHLAKSPKNKDEKRRIGSSMYSFSPVERIRISEAAIDGRNQLGPAVTSKQILSAAYNAILASKDKVDHLFVPQKIKVGAEIIEKLYKVPIIPRTSEEAVALQRGESRAQIGLASDPMDEIGLTGKDVWFDRLFKAHFNIDTGKIVEIKYGRELPISKASLARNFDPASKDYILKPHHLKKGIYGAMADINNAYWGRNWTEGRKYEAHEVMSLGQSIYKVSEEPNRVNTFLPKVGELLVGVDYSDSIFRRLNMDMIRERFDSHSKSVGEYGWLKRWFGRSSFGTPMSEYVNLVMNKKLHTNDGIYRLAGDINEFVKVVKKTPFRPNKEEWKELYTSESSRILALRKIANLAEDFMTNDLTDMVSVEMINDVVSKMVENRDKGTIFNEMSIADGIDYIHRAVETLKYKSYLMAHDRKKAYDILGDTNLGEKDNKILEEILRHSWEDPKHLEKGDYSEKVTERIKKELSPETMRSESLDQTQIDKEIMAIKEGLTDGGKRLFDHLMLGSINKGDTAKIDKFILDVAGNWDRPLMDILWSLRKAAAKTSTSRLGFSGDAISGEAIREHMGRFNEHVNDMWDRPSKELIKKNEELLSEENMTSEEALKGGLPENDIDPLLYDYLKPTGFEGLKEGEVDAATKSAISEIVTILKGYGPNVGNRINHFVRGVLGKELNAMHKQDFQTLRDILTDIKTGTLRQSLFEKKGVKQSLKRIHYWLFPQAVNREMMREDMRLMTSWGLFTDAKGKVQTGKVALPTWYVDSAQNFIGMANDEAVGLGDHFIKGLKEKLFPYVDSIEDGEALRQMAVVGRDVGYAKEYLAGDKIQSDAYRKRYDKIAKQNNWNKLQKKTYMVNIDGKRVEMTGAKVVSAINEAYTEVFEQAHGFITGDKTALDPYTKGHHDKLQLNPIIDYKTFIRDITTAWQKGTLTEPIWRQYGVDGLRKVARTMLLEMVKTDPKVHSKMSLEPVISTGRINSKVYWPHMFMDKKEMKASIKKATENILKDSKLTDEEKTIKLKQVVMRHRSLSGDWDFSDIEDWHMADEIVQSISEGKKVSESHIKWFNADERAGSMHSRSNHIGGWTVDASAPEAYLRSLSNTYFRQLSQIFGRNLVDTMGKQMYKRYPNDQITAWQNYMKLYIQDSMGNPSVIPQKLLDNPHMKLRGTPYSWWADDRVRDRLNKIMTSVGLNNKDLPPEMQKVDLQTVRALSNLEAKYEMAALLAHPKSMAANIFGGTMHTIASAGLGNLREARKIETLRKINPEWTSMQDVNEFVTRHGVWPEQLVYEFGLNKEYQKVQNKQFITDISQRLTRHPNMKEDTVLDIAKKYRVTEPVMNFAAKFMSVPERTLRRDAFMAHYMQAWKHFGGAIKDPNHPLLIKMAKKGVQATQFLYSAPYRPAFARSALGKVMSRFMLWSWNAVRFRNDVNRRARQYGLKPGSASYEQFQRTAQIDLFVLALSNVFMYSLFEQTLPAPWNWLQDTADWIFGNERERDRAFFGQWPKGLAPLQMITPPILRLGPASFKAWLDDDWSKISEYYVWTMFPFGRMARDIAGPGNLIENPMRVMEKTTGFPLIQLQKKASQPKDDEKLYPGHSY